jgi:queuine tRNA-ribosyltransferase accessory subunit
VFQIESATSKLRRFISLPQDSLLVLGARRQPPIACPASNTNSQIGISTAVGFRNLTSEYYAAAANILQPDIVVGLADIPFGQEAVGRKRKEKMGDRTEVWMKDIIAKRGAGVEEKDARPKYNIFAPILPIERELQTWYLDHLLDDMLDQVQGLAIYDSTTIGDLPAELEHFPRLSFDNPTTPQDVLRQVGRGVDVFTVPFISAATDAGIALDFTFPAPPKTSETSARHSLGLDMWLTEHSTSLEPLTSKCSCYACSKHHRVYIQHLLSAKEMLGWTLIQIHNHAIMTAFFDGVRETIEKGTFDADINAFEAYYEPQLPEKTGQGPRVRGYQYSSTENAKPNKKNPKAYKPLNAFHGQQPNAKPEVRNNIDDDALAGLADLENLPPTGDEGVEVRDDQP